MKPNMMVACQWGASVSSRGAAEWFLHGGWHQNVTEEMRSSPCVDELVPRTHLNADLLEYMEKNWPNLLESDDRANTHFWAHEWRKHGRHFGEETHDDYFRRVCVNYDSLDADLGLHDGVIGREQSVSHLLYLIEAEVGGEVELFGKEHADGKLYVHEVRILFDGNDDVIDILHGFSGDIKSRTDRVLIPDRYVA